MYLYFTDALGNKIQLSNSECITDLISAADEHAKRRFVFIKKLRVVGHGEMSPMKYALEDNEGNFSGYSIEE